MLLSDKFRIKEELLPYSGVVETAAVVTLSDMTLQTYHSSPCTQVILCVVSNV